MKIIDAQLHDPAPWQDWTGKNESVKHDILTEITLAYLDAIGIDGVVIVAGDPVWAANAAAEYPARIRYVKSISPDEPDIDAFVADAAAQMQNGLVGLRSLIGWPIDGTEVRRLENGDWEPIYAACAKHGVPVFLFITRFLPLAAGILERHPTLKLVIDHLGLRQPPMDDVESPPFKSLPDLLDLARFPNVSVKVCGLPAMSEQHYPYTDVVPHLRAMIDAFGADRLMWGSDIGRFYGRIGLGRFENPRAVVEYPGKHSYEESLNFIRHNTALTPDEKAWLLGGTVQRLLQWS